MLRKIDHPLVRADHTCPVCERYKDAGLLACWECFNNATMSSADKERCYNEREDQLAQRQSSAAKDFWKQAVAADETECSFEEWCSDVL